MKRRGLLTALAAAAVALAPAPTAASSGGATLRVGSHGPHVSALQWMLAGHRPNVYREIKPTFHAKPNGLFGDRTAHAVTAYKFRLGYPTHLVRPIAGPYFFALLEGKVKRTAPWIVRAAARVKAIEASQPSALALRWKAILVDWLGITEYPYGANRGPCISYPCTWHGHSYPSIQSATGAYGAAWCVSTQQQAAALAGYGHFANDTASVYYAADYYAARNMLHAKPKVGALVMFIEYDRYGHRIPGTGHMGFIAKVTATGFSSIEGNASNRVLERYHRLGERPMVFAYLPGVA